MATTPSQTVGPFFAIELPYGDGPRVVAEGTEGAIWLRGRVLDGAGDPVPDALIELWQADPSGRVPREAGSLRRDGFTFTGWGRSATDDSGRFSFATLAPGATSSGGAPFFAITVFARGLLDRLLTRAYLPGDTAEQAAALAADPLLASVEEGRRQTLVARADEHGFVFDIRLQGADETVFLAHPQH